jgi:hypothetical protein
MEPQPGHSICAATSRWRWGWNEDVVVRHVERAAMGTTAPTTPLVRPCSRCEAAPVRVRWSGTGTRGAVRPGHGLEARRSTRGNIVEPHGTRNDHSSRPAGRIIRRPGTAGETVERVRRQHAACGAADRNAIPIYDFPNQGRQPLRARNAGTHRRCALGAYERFAIDMDGSLRRKSIRSRFACDISRIQGRA